MKRRRTKQKAELRLVAERQGQFALLWQANLNGDDLYAGTARHGDYEVFRFSYHATGQTHFYVGSQRIVTQRRPETAQLQNAQRLLTWNPGLLTPGYESKPDSKTRRTSHLSLGDSMPLAIELWAVEGGRTTKPLDEVMKEKPYTYKSCEVLASVVADWTNPQVVAVAWTFSKDMKTSVEHQIGPMQGQPGLYMSVDRTIYHYHPRTGLSFVKLRDK